MTNPANPFALRSPRDDLEPLLRELDAQAPHHPVTSPSAYRGLRDSIAAAAASLARHNSENDRD